MGYVQFCSICLLSRHSQTESQAWKLTCESYGCTITWKSLLSFENNGTRRSFRSRPRWLKHYRNLCLAEESLKRLLSPKLFRPTLRPSEHRQQALMAAMDYTWQPSLPAGPAQVLGQWASTPPCFLLLCDRFCGEGERRNPEQARALMSCGTGKRFGLAKCASPALNSQRSPCWLIRTGEHLVCPRDSSFPFLIGRTALLCGGSYWFLFSFHPSSGCISFFSGKHCLWTTLFNV